MPPELVVVNNWKGVDRRGPGTVRSERNGLDAPRELINVILDDNQHIYMPEALTDEVYDFTGEGSIVSIRYSENPGGVLVQTETKIHFVPRGASAPAVDVTPTSADWKIWAVGFGTHTYFGYGARGTESTSQTFDLYYDSDLEVYVIDEITDPVQPDASFSVMYKGRRFAMFRGRVIRYSELNEPLEFLFEDDATDNEFDVGGDDGGNSLISNPGFVKGMVAWEDVLIMFLTGSIWTFTGAGPESWQLRQNMTLAGNTSEWTLVPLEGGVMSYGGTNTQDEGFYIFTGSETRKVSQAIDEYVALWISGLNDVERDPRFEASYQHGHYIVSLGHDTAAELQILLWNSKTGNWMTFDGFVKSAYCPAGWGTYYADGTSLMLDGLSRTIKRKSGRKAKITLGYDDDGILGRYTRFVGLKLFGKKTGGSPTVKVTVLTSEGKTVNSGEHTLTTDSFDGLVLPINIRGKAIELTIEITPATDADTVLIESLQLIKSVKGNKLSTA